MYSVKSAGLCSYKWEQEGPEQVYLPPWLGSRKGLCGNFELKRLKVPSVLFEKQHSPTAELRSLGMSLSLAPTCAFVLLTHCSVKSFSQMVSFLFSFDPSVL